MELNEVYETAILPAYCRLPASMNSQRATVMLLANGLQESRFTARVQGGGGPARSFWQFEQGEPRFSSGVAGVLQHPASRQHLIRVCSERGTPATARAIYIAIADDDVLAAVCARLLLWTDAKSLPQLGESKAAWALYLRCWNPGKPHPETWGRLYARAEAFVRALP